MCDVSVILIDRSNWREFAALDIKENQYDLLPPRTGMYMLARHYAEPEWEIFAFVLDDKLIGGFSLRMFEGEKRCGIERFFIHKDYQGKGYGKAGFTAILDFIREKHPEARIADLTVTPDNKRALRLYLDAGFEINDQKNEEGLIWLEHRMETERQKT